MSADETTTTSGATSATDIPVTDTPAKKGPPAPVKVIAVVLGTAVLLSVMVTMFALPAARSAPHHVPIGVVGSEQVVSQVDRLTGDSFDVTAYSDEVAARDAIETLSLIHI